MSDWDKTGCCSEADFVANNYTNCFPCLSQPCPATCLGYGGLTIGEYPEADAAAFWGYMGVAVGFVTAILGSAYGTAVCALGIQSAGINNPGSVMKNLISVVMAGIIGIYGLIVAVMILQKIDYPDYDKFDGYAHFAAGCCTGLSGLVSGIALGVCGNMANRAIAVEPKLFIGSVLIFIFSNAPALYGFLMSILLISSG